MSGLLAAELYKLSRRPMTWIALGIILFLFVAVRILLFVAASATSPQGTGDATPGVSIQVSQSDQNATTSLQDVVKEAVTLPGGLSDGINFLSGLGIFALVVVAASMTGNEFSWGTIGLLASRGTARWKIATAKLLGLMMITILWLIVIFLAAVVLSAIGSAIYHQAILGSWLTGRFVLTVLLSLGRAFLALLPYVTATVAIGLLLRSSAVTMGCILGYLFAEQIAVPVISQVLPATHGFLHRLLTLVQEVLIGGNASVMRTLNTQQLASSTQLLASSTTEHLHPYRAAGILIAYTLFFCILAILALQKRDLAPRASAS